MDEELDALVQIYMRFEAGTEFRLKNLYPRDIWEAKEKRERSELGKAFRARVSPPEVVPHGVV